MFTFRSTHFKCRLEYVEDAFLGEFILHVLTAMEFVMSTRRALSLVHRGTSICSTEELLMARLIGDAMTEAALNHERRLMTIKEKYEAVITASVNL